MARFASPAKRQEWQERFARQGLPIPKFCEAEGVKPRTFWYRRRNLAGNATPRPKLAAKADTVVTPVAFDFQLGLMGEEGLEPPTLSV